MPSIAKCPRCNQEVTIPDGVEPQASVRCPLCSAMYPIGDAMAGAPPALIPIATPPGQGLKSDSDSLLKSDLGEGPFHTSDSGSTDDSSDTPAKSHSGALREPAGIDAWEKVDSGIDLESSDVVDTGAFAGFAEEDPEAPGSPGVSSATKPRRKKKQKSMAKEMGGAIIGGFLGLAIGYYGLNYFGGERFDFLKLYLPGVAHTEKHNPWPDADEAQEPREESAPADDPPDPDPDSGLVPNPDLDPEPVPQPTQVVQPEPPTVASPDGPPSEPPIVEPVVEPEPAPLPDGYVGLREPPSFSSDDLGQALKAAHDRIVTVADIDTLPAEAFEELCRLGQVATFVEDALPDGRLLSRKEAVRGILQGLADGPGRIDEIGVQAGRLIEREEVTEPGILLAGTVRSVLSKGGLHGMTIQLAVQPNPISVLSDTPLPFESGDQVVILGSIVTNPSKNLVGYSGSKPKVIWVGMAVKAGR